MRSKVAPPQHSTPNGSSTWSISGYDGQHLLRRHPGGDQGLMGVPQHRLSAFFDWFFIFLSQPLIYSSMILIHHSYTTPKIAMKVPAATAVPITPATFGPIACISRKFVGSASAPTFWDTRACHRNGRYTCRTNQRIDLAAGKLAHQFSKKNTSCGTECECSQTQRITIFNSVHVQECFCTGGSTYRSTQQDNNDVHQSIGSGLR